MIIALAGRRVDPAGTTPARFPLENVELVSWRIRQALIAIKASGLVASAACGADLLALDEAGKLGLRRRIILPFGRDEFRASSVTDRPGNWGPLYDRIVDEVVALGDLVILGNSKNRHAGYVVATGVILDQAIRLACACAQIQSRAEATADGKDKVLAIVVWDEEPRSPDEHSVAFTQQAASRHVPILSISTL